MSSPIEICPAICDPEGGLDITFVREKDHYIARGRMVAIDKLAKQLLDEGNFNLDGIFREASGISLKIIDGDNPTVPGIELQVFRDGTRKTFVGGQEVYISENPSAFTESRLLGQDFDIELNHRQTSSSYGLGLMGKSGFTMRDTYTVENSQLVVSPLHPAA